MTVVTETERVQRAAAFLRERLGADRCARLRLGVVLGSGFKDFAAALDDRVELPLSAVPEWPAPQVHGHGGSLVAGRVGQCSVVCLTGRVHLYEGWSPGEVVRAVRTLRTIGVPTFLLTNAAGGIGDSFGAGDLMVLTDHLNLTGRSPLTGPHEEAFGPRFPDQSAVYDPELRALLLRCGNGLQAGLQQGVYAGLPGPAYETPAEVRMLKAMGADAVGMSTVLEATALRAMDAEVCGLSLISNLAAGIADTPLHHDEVLAAGQKAAAALTSLLTGFCRHLPAPK